MRFLLFLIGLVCVSATAMAGQLSANIRITSEHLGYDLQYWVYYPSGVKTTDQLPTLYLADGQLYLEYGKLHGLIDDEIKAGRIKPIIAVFIDPRDPYYQHNNRRAHEFVCNQDYVNFFRDELIPAVERQFPVSTRREDRVIAGLSLGGLNAGCFGVMASDQFAGIAMQSPAYYPFSDLKERYEAAPLQPIKIFFSVGKKETSKPSSRRLRKVLADKGYDLIYREVHHRHDWKNWGPLQDDILHHFFAVSD
ncbi:alpha/beta hydrolase [Kordiimonas lacus]|uniref:Enterochelin esterase n=1 Tax=Kordiimonas lacus TaxID=637679 RepID=A0A1G6U448_9PROT|nr:alpha/beta hydrolase-fold protein [Kordiimonas lacus]SDD36051.1 Enterochelin esterase [Kordiimonas lacus]